MFSVGEQRGRACARMAAPSRLPSPAGLASAFPSPCSSPLCTHSRADCARAWAGRETTLLGGLFSYSQPQHYSKQGKPLSAPSSICHMATPSPELRRNKCLCHHMAHQTRELIWMESNSAKARCDPKCVMGMDKREQRERSQLQPTADKPLITIWPSAAPSEPGKAVSNKVFVVLTEGFVLATLHCMSETSVQYFCFSTFLLHGLLAIWPLFYTVLQCHLNAVESTS